MSKKITGIFAGAIPDIPECGEIRFMNLKIGNHKFEFKFNLMGAEQSQGEVHIKVVFNSGLAFVIFTAHHFLEGRMKSLIRRD